MSKCLKQVSQTIWGICTFSGISMIFLLAANFYGLSLSTPFQIQYLSFIIPDPYNEDGLNGYNRFYKKDGYH